MSELCSIESHGDGPLVAIALHDGHDVRPELKPLYALSAEGRLREEDPFTGEWTRVAPHRVVVHRSRFEVDLNRPPETCVYRVPEDAWGLRVWQDPLPDDTALRSRRLHVDFYATMQDLLGRMAERWDRFVVFDLHSYNHRRGGPKAEPADPELNPEVNLGTGSLDRARWGSVADTFLGVMRRVDVGGRTLDVRENVKFRGGYFSQWVHRTFPESACCLAIEFKKFFMDEWTAAPDRSIVDAIGSALQETASSVLTTLGAQRKGEGA